MADKIEGLTIEIGSGASVWRVPPTRSQRYRMRDYVRRAEAIGVKERCGTCAFRRGTPANNSRLVVQLIERCMGDPASGNFMCHEPMGQETPDRVCAGYAALVGAEQVEQAKAATA